MSTIPNNITFGEMASALQAMLDPGHFCRRADSTPKVRKSRQLTGPCEEQKIIFREMAQVRSGKPYRVGRIGPL
jgi:hypothetical protein